MANNKKTLEEYILDATTNIQNDRDLASRLLQDIMVDITNNPTDKYRHRNLGEAASRYLETLQRSNEQLVKLTALVQKKESNKKQELSEIEKDNIFDLILSDKQ